MAGISTAIQLQDNFTRVFHNVIESVSLGITAMEDLNRTMSIPVDMASIEAARNSINQAAIAVRELDTAMEQTGSNSINQPLPVFTGTGMERFQQEVQSTDSMLEQLSVTQAEIARQAYNTLIFPTELANDLVNISYRIDEIKNKIQQIEGNPLNMGTDLVNNELEQLRSQLNSALTTQQDLNNAIGRMDVSAVNTEYSRLNSIVQNTERYIRDNVDEQGRFNSEIQEGTNYASKLKSMIMGAVGGFLGIAGIKKAFSFINDCTKDFNTQLNAENQLITVLGNMLDEDYVSKFTLETTADTTAAINEINDIQSNVDTVTVTVSAESKALYAEYDSIMQKASEIQSKGIYDSGSMVAAAAEFATYFTDVDAVTSMMDTLADYAMGMSGGGEIDSSQMVNYATNLGKIMSGSFDAMTQKGFEFTEAQKAIIEGNATQEQIIAAIGKEYLNMTEDMQAAAAISQVIEESWGGLYEVMSNTPEGKIIQLNNAWSEMKTVIGEQLYPYVLLFVDTINENWGTMETVVNAITNGLKTMLSVLNWILDGAMKVANVIIDNWSWISPIITGLAFSFGLLAIALGACKVATALYTFAQDALNMEFLACPLTWVVLAIIAVIVAIYAVVGCINKLCDTTISATGIIMGAFLAATGVIYNLFWGIADIALGVINFLVNPFIDFANFIGNFLDNPVSSIIHLFEGMHDNVLSIIEKIASAIDMVFGSNLADTVSNWRVNLKNSAEDFIERYAPDENYEEIFKKLDLSTEALAIERMNYIDLFNTGYAFGENLEDKMSNFGNLDDTLSPIEDALNRAANSQNGFDSNDIDSIDEVGKVKNVGGEVNVADEDLKALRELATMEFMQNINQNTIAPVVEVRIEEVKETADIDKVIERLTEKVKESVNISAEGVY